MKSFAFLAVVMLTACAHQPQVITRTVTPPPLLTQPVPKPIKPNAKTATQKDVAVYLVELNGALDLANFKLILLDEWRQKWTTQIEQAKKNKQTVIRHLRLPVKQ